jgi:hypothetical protein
MSVNDREYVGTLSVNAKVHLDFRGGIELTLELLSRSVYFDDHIGGKVALGYACRGAVILVIANLNGDVTVVCSDEALRIKLMTYLADFLFDFEW